MSLKNNINNLIIVYEKDYICTKKIDKLHNFLENEIDDLQEELEDHFERYLTNNFTNYSDYLKYICKYIVEGKIEEKECDDETYIIGFDKVTLKDEELLNNFIILIYSYLLGNIDYEKAILLLFLQCHDIDYKLFPNINKISAFALCELKENGIDIKPFSHIGNYQLAFINEMSRGFYRNQDTKIKALNNITATLDNAFKTNDMLSLNIDDTKYLLFESTDSNSVCIYINTNMSTPIVEALPDNTFVKGNLNTILQYYDFNQQVVLPNNNVNSLDQFINSYSSPEIVEQIEPSINSEELVRQLYKKLIDNDNENNE